METMLIEVSNEKVAKLLHELEELELIKVLQTNGGATSKLSEKYAGKLPSHVAEEMQEYITKGRNEWNNSSI